MNHASMCLVLLLFVVGCGKRSTEVHSSDVNEPDVKMVALVSQQMRAGHVDLVPHERIPNLSTDDQRNEVFVVPEGVSNVALHKPVTSSCAELIYGKVESITDGVMEGRGNIAMCSLGLGFSILRSIYSRCMTYTRYDFGIAIR